MLTDSTSILFPHITKKEIPTGKLLIPDSTKTTKWSIFITKKINVFLLYSITLCCQCCPMHRYSTTAHSHRQVASKVQFLLMDRVNYLTMGQNKNLLKPNTTSFWKTQSCLLLLHWQPSCNCPRWRRLILMHSSPLKIIHWSWLCSPKSSFVTLSSVRNYGMH